jgi:transposase
MFGHRRVTLQQIEMIVELTRKGTFRPDIAKETGVSTFSVYKYQKEFNLV